MVDEFILKMMLGALAFLAIAVIIMFITVLSNQKKIENIESDIDQMKGEASDYRKDVDDTLRRTVNIMNKISVSIPARHAKKEEEK